MVKKSMWKSLSVLLGLLTWTSCQPASLSSSKPISAAALSKEYERSSADVRGKYDGKEIIVRGYAAEAAIVPPPGDDQGLVLLEEKDQKPARQVACWFSEDQAEQFAKINVGQLITVKGIFNGEVGADLRFCKLVTIE